jgi:hypothetical protein
VLDPRPEAKIAGVNPVLLADSVLVLGAVQLEVLHHKGWVRLTDAVSADETAIMAERVWAFFARRGVDRADPSTWPVGLSSKLQGLRQSGLFNPFAAITAGVLDQLLGAGCWTETESWGPVPVTWPQPEAWEVPHRNWHFDLPARGDPDRPGAARLFGFISQVDDHGGGTLVVEGSHELVRRQIRAASSSGSQRSNELRHRLSRLYPWFAALTQPGGSRTSRFMIDGDEIDGVAVRVVELTGNPGDVMAMMPWTMHAFSMNSAAYPRFMVTHTVLRHDQPFYA